MFLPVLYFVVFSLKKSSTSSRGAVVSTSKGVAAPLPAQTSFWNRQARTSLTRHLSRPCVCFDGRVGDVKTEFE